ncbi:hypothetical protein ACFLV3_02850 [Chloroflexota bacterium]
MAKKVGKVQKPEAEHFASKRKLYLVPLIFSGKDAPAEYVEKFNLYWAQVNEHIANLESKIGKVNHVFHETVTTAAEDALQILGKVNPSCYQIITNKCQNGAVFEATEDEELAEESMDWERCLLIGLISEKVAKMISEFYVEALRKRYDYISRKIDETLNDNEAGMLFIREGHMVQFPQDIEVFSVTPPALDDIHRWHRDRLSTEKKSEQ